MLFCGLFEVIAVPRQTMTHPVVVLHQIHIIKNLEMPVVVLFETLEQGSGFRPGEPSFNCYHKVLVLRMQGPRQPLALFNCKVNS
jgi:hypothetical protein